MNWLFFTVLAYFLWAIVVVLDGLIVKRYIKNPITFLFIATFFSGFLSLLIIPFAGLRLIDFNQLMLALLAGLIFVYGLLPYLKAMRFEEISRVGPLWHFSPVFVLIISRIFLKEVLTPNQYAGFFLLVFGGFLISCRKLQGAFRLSRAFWLMLLSTFLFAIYLVLTKYIFLSGDFINSFIWIRIGTLLGALSLLLAKGCRRGCIPAFLRLKKKIQLVVISDRVIDFIALFSINFAIVAMPVSVVSSFEGLQSFFTLAIMLLVSIKFPRIAKEEIDRKTVAYKLLAIILMAAGVYFIVA